MGPDLWRRINEILPLALELPPGERTEFLEEACGGDAALRREVDSLLAVGTARLARLDRISCREPSWTGRRLGPYLLEEEIGRGGMGAVYAARRVDDAYRHRVAVKILRRGMDSDELVRRFQAERRILASLDDPRIARFLDGGTTPDHRPFFVLELIEGQPIDRWCEERELPVEARLRLFLEVCAAVQAAHRNLVVHRDLKPGNILVTRTGEPRLLDFGIAKLLEPGGDALTVPDLRPMTPGYASPEQVRGEPVTTASDVYSLGVLLHELLTRRRPAVAPDGETIRPSTAVDRRLARRLRGDLDSVLLKALEREPRRRYGSAEELADDLRHHLERRPVRARQATFLYRAGKLVRRRRRALAAAVLLTAAAAAGAADRLAQHRQTERERDRAQRISSFTIDLIRSSDPWEEGGTARSREVLARSVRRAEASLADEPEIQAELLLALGELHCRFGLVAEARPLLEKAMELRRAHFGPGHPLVAEMLERLGELEREQGRHPAAEARFEEALAIRRRAGDPAVAQSMAAFAVLRRDQGRLQEAEGMFRQALDLLRRNRPWDDRHLLACAGNLSLLLMDQGRLDEAEPLLREALAGFRATRSTLSLEASTVLNHLGNLLWTRGDLQAAEPFHREALAARRRLLEPGHPEVGASAHNLALLLIYRGRLEEAEPLVREALRIFRETLGARHPKVAVSLNNLAFLLAEEDRFGEAEALYRESLAITRSALGEDRPQVARNLRNLAVLLLRQGRPAEAAPLARQAVALAGRVLGEHHPETAYYRLDLAQLDLLAGETGKAETVVRQALEDLRRGLPPGHWNVAMAESMLGDCLRAQGRLAEAAPLLSRSASALAAARGERSSFARDARARLARLPSP